MVDPGVFLLLSPRLHGLETSNLLEQRLHLAMVALTQKSFSAQYAWFSRGGSQIVTGFEKTFCMGFFVKTEFDASLISSTLELTHLQV